MPVAICVSLVVFCLTVYVLAANMRGFAVELIGAAPRLDAVIAKLAGAMGMAVPPTLGRILQSLSPAEYIGRIAGSLRGLMTDAVLVLIYLGFLLASRQGFERKTGRLFTTTGERRHAGELFLRIRGAIEQYLWIQSVTCGLIAVASGVVMTLLGLNNALFWAFVIFIVGFIPIIGGAVGILAPPLFALAQFDGWWRAAVMIVALQVINFIVGNIVYPRMQGRSLNIDPVAILLSLAFWGAIWGLPGMFLSTPLTVMTMVVLAQFRSTRWIAVLLSSDGDPLGQRRSAPGDRPEKAASETFTQA
jgi:AI-2 transport protein TqsA